MYSTKQDTSLILPASVRDDFPILQQQVYGHPLVYLDNAATTQKPVRVLDAIEDYYRRYNANVHRGVHHLSQVATEAYELARKRAATFLNAANMHEVIFTRGTTEGINLIAYSYCNRFVNKGDEIVVSAIEHHSNIVPWQMACLRRGATLKVIPVSDKGELDMEAYAELLNPKVKLVATGYVSNTLGTVNPVHDMIRAAHAHGIPVLVDAAQAVQHMKVDVQELDADFLVFSSHKIYGPTGMGILYGKERWLNEMEPYEGGGDMIKTVTFEKTVYNDLPFKFEAGTPDMAGAIGLHAALDYVSDLGLDRIAATEADLLTYALGRLSEIPALRFIGRADHRAGAISFLVGNIHPFDLGELLDKQGIAVRTGHHCTQPIMDRFGIPGTVRASFALYNTRAEIDKLVDGILKAVRMLA